MIQNNLATLCKKTFFFFKICSVKINDPTSEHKYDQMEGSVKTLPSIRISSEIFGHIYHIYPVR